SGMLEIVDSLVSDNFAFPSRPDPHLHGSACGVGIYNDINGTLDIRNSTVSGNYTQSLPFNGSGGGLYNSWVAEITASTISGNYADGGGGGIHNSGPLTIINSTLSGNFSSPSGINGGGSIRNVNGGELQISNTILNSGSADSIFKNLGKIISLGYNLCSDDG